MSIENTIEQSPAVSKSPSTSPTFNRRQFLRFMAVLPFLPEQGAPLISRLPEQLSATNLEKGPDPEQDQLPWADHFKIMDEIIKLKPAEKAKWDKAKQDLTIVAEGINQQYSWGKNLKDLNDQREKDPQRPESEKIKPLFRKLFLGDIPEEFIPTETVIPFYAAHKYSLDTHQGIINVLKFVKNTASDDKLAFIYKSLSKGFLEALENEASDFSPHPEVQKFFPDEEVQYIDNIAIVTSPNRKVTPEGLNEIEKDSKKIRDQYIARDFDYFKTAGLKTLIVIDSDRYGKTEKRQDSSVGGAFTVVRDSQKKLMGLMLLNMDNLADNKTPFSDNLIFKHETGHAFSILTNGQIARSISPKLALDQYLSAAQSALNGDWGPQSVGLGETIFNKRPSYRRQAKIINNEKIDVSGYVGTTLEYPANVIAWGLDSNNFFSELTCQHLNASQNEQGIVQTMVEKVVANKSFFDEFNSRAKNPNLPQQYQETDLNDIIFPFNQQSGSQKETVITPDDNGQEPKQYPTIGDFMKDYRQVLESHIRNQKLEGVVSKEEILLKGIDRFGHHFDQTAALWDVTGPDSQRLIPTGQHKSWRVWENYVQYFLLRPIVRELAFTDTAYLASIMPRQSLNRLLTHFVINNMRAVFEAEAERIGYYHYLGPRLEESEKAPIGPRLKTLASSLTMS